MRQRTPSEIKAYGDGYAEAYKEFCHLLDRHDKDKAIRKMKIFVDAVALTVETATGEPQSVTYNPTSVNNIWEKPTNPYVPNEQTEPTISKMEQVDKDINVRSKTENSSEKPNNSTISKMEQVDEPIDRDDLGNCNICKYVGLEHRCNQCVNGSMFCKVEDEPQKHCHRPSDVACHPEQGDLWCRGCDYWYANEPQTERSE